MAEYGPCAGWTVQWTCDTSGKTQEQLDNAEQFATAVVWALSGRQFGLCDVTVRPCRYECFETPWLWDGWLEWPGTGQWPYPALINGVWMNLACGICPGRCQCTMLSEVLLAAPVNDIIEVLIDGQVLDPSSYQLLDRRVLVRSDGGTWPRCNDLSQSNSEPGTWSIQASYGQPPPEGAALAVGEMACQVLKAMAGEADCRLPAGVTQLIRQGVTIEFPDIGELFRSGRTGLYLVDAFVATWNPNRLQTRAKTFSVDRQKPTRVVTFGS